MENWKPVIGWESLYEVSSYGRVRSLEREVTTKAGLRKLPSVLLSPGVKKNYPFVFLSRDGKSKFVHVHRLVATAFIPNVENKPQVNHKDMNCTNNNAENLEWVTARENISHAMENGVRFGKFATSLHSKHPKQTMIIDADSGKELMIVRSRSMAARVCNCSEWTVYWIVNGKRRRTCQNFSFKNYIQ